MKDIIGKAFLAGLGAASLTREKSEGIINDLVKRGEVSWEEKPGLLDDLVKAGEKHKNEIQGLIQKEVQKVMGALDIPTRQEYETLREQIEQLSKREDSADKS